MNGWISTKCFECSSRIEKGSNCNMASLNSLFQLLPEPHSIWPAITCLPPPESSKLRKPDRTPPLACQLPSSMMSTMLFGDYQQNNCSCSFVKPSQQCRWGTWYIWSQYSQFLSECCQSSDGGGLCQMFPVYPSYMFECARPVHHPTLPFDLTNY